MSPISPHQIPRAGKFLAKKPSFLGWFKNLKTSEVKIVGFFNFLVQFDVYHMWR